MKRTSIALVGTMLAAVCVAAASSATGVASGARTAVFHTVELRKTSAGKILVNTSGSILFEFTKDSSKHDSCVKIHGCDQIWIPEPVSGKPSAGPGLEGSQLSTIKLSAGNDQVTYAGHPLYVYAADPTAASYIGFKSFGGTWYAVNAKGQPVK